MKHIDKLFVGCFVCALAFFAFFPRKQTVQPEQYNSVVTQTSKTKQTRVARSKKLPKPMMKKFVAAVDEMKRVCEKTPNYRLSKLLIESDSLNAQIDTDAIICIGQCLEQDEKVRPLAQKISKRLHKNKKLLDRCFIQEDPKSFAEFQRVLKSSTVRCSGLSCLWDKSTSQAAAFVAAAKCIEGYSQ